jgi:hypothetical protein
MGLANQQTAITITSMRGSEKRQAASTNTSHFGLALAPAQKLAGIGLYRVFE